MPPLFILSFCIQFMSERNDDDRPEVPDLIVPPRPQKGGKPVDFMARASTQSTLRHRAIDGEITEASQKAIRDLQELFRIVSDSPAQDVVKKVVSNPEYVRQVAALQILVGRVFQQLRLVMNIFSTPFAVDPESGHPVLDEGNVAKLLASLDHAQRHLSSAPPRLAQPMEARPLTPPNGDFVRLLRTLNNNPKFLESDVAMMRLFQILDDYLRSFLQATHLGVIAEVGQTTMEVGKLAAATAGIDRERRDDMRYEGEVSPETRQKWLDLLMEAEYTFTGLYTRLLDVLGPQADALLRHIPGEVLRKMLQDLSSQADAVKKQLEPKTPAEEGRNALARFGAAVKGMLSLKEEAPPSNPPGNPRVALREIEDNRAALLAVLQKRTKLGD